MRGLGPGTPRKQGLAAHISFVGGFVGGAWSHPPVPEGLVVKEPHAAASVQPGPSSPRGGPCCGLGVLEGSSLGSGLSLSLRIQIWHQSKADAAC